MRNFKFTKMVGFYHVEINGVYLGVVRREEDWTVRGTRVRWTAARRGRTIATSCATRNEAAEMLLPKQKD